MTKHARKEERRSKSGERPSVRALLAAAPVTDIGEAEARRKPRRVNRPATSDEEGHVTLGFRGTEEDDEVIRKAVEVGGYYSKADLIRKATMKLATELVGDSVSRERKIAEAAAKLGVDPQKLIAETLDALIKQAKVK